MRESFVEPENLTVVETQRVISLLLDFLGLKVLKTVSYRDGNELSLVPKDHEMEDDE
jgi:hypothetical protein